MTAKKMVEYSVSVPADRKASIHVDHAPGGTVGSVEIDDVRCDGRLGRTRSTTNDVGGPADAGPPPVHART
ncbi:hypothetical protein [Streptomyces sp. I8-5]|uniref:hypothetical protein n=1 Tax=Streptomyces sp. I8-5 TaxID=3104277 RepID=UPI00386982A7